MIKLNEFEQEALQAMTDHVGTRFNRKDPPLFLDWVSLQTVLANEIQELIQACQSNDVEATLDEAGDVLYVASYGLQFSTEQQAGLAAVGEATVWSQMHYFSPASETITLFLNNIARLQRFVEIPLAAGPESEPLPKPKHTSCIEQGRTQGNCHIP